MEVSTSATGSPPRVRGKQQVMRALRSKDGITPARAGKTFDLVRIHRYGQDHPRACGENAVRRIHDNIVEGSPPRVRGKLRAADLLIGGLRITPARAGKTLNEILDPEEV